jgi:hypothetical protein
LTAAPRFDADIVLVGGNVKLATSPPGGRPGPEGPEGPGPAAHPGRRLLDDMLDEVIPWIETGIANATI